MRFMHLLGANTLWKVLFSFYRYAPFGTKGDDVLAQQSQPNSQIKKKMSFPYSTIDLSRQSEISKLGSRDIYDSVALDDNFTISSLNEILDAPTVDNKSTKRLSLVIL